MAGLLDQLTWSNAVPFMLSGGNPSAIYLANKAAGMAPGLLQGAVSGFTAPGDAYQGKIAPEDMASRAMDTASLMTGGGLASRGESMGVIDPGVLSVSGVKGYHGSPKTDLTELRPSERGPLGPGTYLTPNMNVARQYAGPDGRVYEHTVDGDVFNGLGRMGMTDPSKSYFQVYREETKRLIDAAPKEARDELKAMFEKLSPEDGYRIYGDMRRKFGPEGTEKIFRDAGFIGTSGHVDGPEIVLFGGVPLGR